MKLTIKNLKGLNGLYSLADSTNLDNYNKSKNDLLYSLNKIIVTFDGVQRNNISFDIWSENGYYLKEVFFNRQEFISYCNINFLNPDENINDLKSYIVKTLKGV